MRVSSAAPREGGGGKFACDICQRRRNYGGVGTKLLSLEDLHQHELMHLNDKAGASSEDEGESDSRWDDDEFLDEDGYEDAY